MRCTQAEIVRHMMIFNTIWALNGSPQFLCTALWSNTIPTFWTYSSIQYHLLPMMLLCTNRRRDEKKYKAPLGLPVSSWCLVSGTLAYNRWHDMSGYLDLIPSQPTDSDEKFMSLFARPSYSGSASRDTGGAQLCLLQQFLQAMIIMRSRDVLQLPPCHRFVVPVDATPEQEEFISDLVTLYKRCVGIDPDKPSKLKIASVSKCKMLMERAHWKWRFALSCTACAPSLHPFLRSTTLISN